MKKINCAALALFAAACSGTDATVLDEGAAWEVGLPRGVARIDGHVDRDHIFYDETHRETYCGIYPESPACTEIGAVEQTWISAEYHGMDDTQGSNIPCYAPNSDKGACLFPRYKRIKYIFDTTNCYPTLADANHDAVNALRGSAIRAGIESGMKRWHDSASGVSVENNACSTGTCMTVNVSCANLTTATGSPFAIGGLSGVVTTQHSNLPSGPHGRIDQGAARTINGGILTVDPGKILDFYVENCDPDPTRGELGDFARYVGAHELGHVFGFEHFGSGPDNLMAPTASCADIAVPGIAPFAAALGVYAPTGDSDATILDVNLELQGP